MVQRNRDCAHFVQYGRVEKSRRFEIVSGQWIGFKRRNTMVLNTLIKSYMHLKLCLKESPLLDSRLTISVLYFKGVLNNVLSKIYIYLDFMVYHFFM